MLSLQRTSACYSLRESLATGMCTDLIRLNTSPMDSGSIGGSGHLPGPSEPMNPSYPLPPIEQDEAAALMYPGTRLPAV